MIKSVRPVQISETGSARAGNTQRIVEGRVLAGRNIIDALPWY